MESINYFYSDCWFTDLYVHTDINSSTDVCYNDNDEHYDQCSDHTNIYSIRSLLSEWYSRNITNDIK